MSALDDARAVLAGNLPPGPEYRRALAALVAECEAAQLCKVCGGRGWHTAGGNDPMGCGACSAGEAWSA